MNTTKIVQNKMKAKLALVLCACIFATAFAQCPWDDLTGLTNFSTILNNLQEGDNVTLADVVIDTSMPFPLGVITINGKVVIDPRKSSSILILADVIYINHGQLIVGSANCPIPINHTITFEFSNNYAILLPFIGTKAMAVVGNTSTLWMFGSYRTPAWTNLAHPAAPGASSFSLADPVTWTTGDRIVVSSSDFDPFLYEELTVVWTSNDGKVVHFTPPLKYLHWGGLASTESGDTVDESAQVAILDRNIKLQSDNKTDENGYGYDMRIMQCGPEGAHVHGVECTRGGKQTVLGTYPLHFHMMREFGRFASFQDNSIHHNYQRCLTVHATNHSLVKNNVGIDTFGHCFFMEDGNEQNNTFEGNVAFATRSHPRLLLPTDESAASFWITNPLNRFRGNVAGGSEGAGFWLAFPRHPTGPFASPHLCPDHTPLTLFEDNIAHSNEDGLFLDGGPDIISLQSIATDYIPRSIPCDPTSPTLNATITNYVGYKNRRRGSWTRGSAIIFDHPTYADNKIGLTDAAHSEGSYCFDCHFIGITNNVGTPTAQCEIEAGRSFGEGECDYPIRGYEFYDRSRRLVSGSCAGYIPTSTYAASCLSVLRFSEEAGTAYSYVGPFAITDASQGVYIARDGGDGVASASFIDMAGDVSGFEGGRVTVNANFLFAPGCRNLTHANVFFCPNANHLGGIVVTNLQLAAACIDYDIAHLANQSAVCNATIDRIISSQQVVYGSKPTLRLVRNDPPFATANLIGDVDGDSGAISDYPSLHYSTNTLLNQSLSAYWSFQIPNSTYIETDPLSGAIGDFIEIHLCLPEGVEVISVQRYLPANASDEAASDVPPLPPSSASAFSSSPPAAYYLLDEFDRFQILRYRLGFDAASNLFLTLHVPPNTLFSSCNFDQFAAAPNPPSARPPHVAVASDTLYFPPHTLYLPPETVYFSDPSHPSLSSASHFSPPLLLSLLFIIIIIIV